MFIKDKDYTNYKKATVFDIESDNLLDEATKIYIVGFKLYNKPDVNVLWGDTQGDRIVNMFKWHIDNKIPVACHNSKTFDIPLLEKIYGIDLSELVVIDTLALSWYLNINKEKHSLEELAKDYDVDGKYFIDEKDWTSLTKEQAIKRVTSDVRINVAIYEDFISRLEDMYSLSKNDIDLGYVGGNRNEGETLYIDSLKGLTVEQHVVRLIEYLSFKKDCQKLTEETKWKVDVPYAESALEELNVLVGEKAQELEAVMPPVPIYSDRKEPAKKFKQNGELSVSGEKWTALEKGLEASIVDQYGNPFFKIKKEGYISELTGYDPPNINSTQQVKDFLFSHGWVPTSFKYVRDEEAMDQWARNKPKKGSHMSAWNHWKKDKPKDRAIPQVRVEGEEGKELCKSVEILAESVPEIKVLEEYTVIKHRYDTLKGILSRTDKDGYAKATCHGYTNTLRLKHMAPLVNLPGAKKKYAEPIRGCLIAPEGFISCGSDLSSLEDRVKHHFMLPYDPEYVSKMMADDYDPHIETAIAVGYITEVDGKMYKEELLPAKIKDSVSASRHKAKQINYSSVYGIGAEKLSISLGSTVEEAKAGLEGYWKLNWSVKAIEEDQIVIEDSKGFKWLINPINGLLYNIRSRKDYFSTLIQGSGAFFFDMWLRNVLSLQYREWSKMTLTGQFHDEFIMVIKDNPKFKDRLSGMIKEAIKMVNEEFLLRRELDCDIQFGKRYSEIH